MFPTPRKEPMLWVVLIPLMALKFFYCYQYANLGWDGRYYIDIAQNIRDGLGVVSDISMYHQGMNFFPHPTPVYPIWPMVLGYLSRIFPMEFLIRWLPGLLSPVFFILGFVLVREAWPVKIFSIKGWRFHTGHVFLLILGLNYSFLWSTALPYTESLTYTLLFLALLRSRHFFAKPGFWRGVELGFWTGLLILVRSQLILVFMAVVLVLPIGVLFVQTRQYLKGSVGYLLGFVAILVPQCLFLASFIPDFSPLVMLRFDSYVASSGLSKLTILVKTSGLLDYIRDRLQGFVVAFHWKGKYSYTHSYHYFQYGLVLATPLWIFAGLRILVKGQWLEIPGWFRRKNNLYRFFLLLFAMGGFFSLHTIHKAMFSTWNFTTRHGITAAFFMLVGLAYLLQRSRVTRYLALAIILVSTVVGFNSVMVNLKKLIKHRQYRMDRVIHYRLIQWINDGTSPTKRLTFVESFPQEHAHLTPDAGYHWICRHTTVNDLLVLFRKKGANYLLLRYSDRRHKFLKDKKRFNKYFSLYKKLSGFKVYRLKPGK